LADAMTICCLTGFASLKDLEHIFDIDCTE